MAREKTFSVRESDLSAGVPNVCLLWWRAEHIWQSFSDLRNWLAKIGEIESINSKEKYKKKYYSTIAGDQTGEKTWSKQINLSDFLESGQFEIQVWSLILDLWSEVDLWSLQVQARNNYGYGNKANDMIRVTVPEKSDGEGWNSSLIVKYFFSNFGKLLISITSKIIKIVIISVGIFLKFVQYKNQPFQCLPPRLRWPLLPRSSPRSSCSSAVNEYDDIFRWRDRRHLHHPGLRSFSYSPTVHRNALPAFLIIVSLVLNLQHLFYVFPYSTPLSNNDASTALPAFVSHYRNIRFYSCSKLTLLALLCIRTTSHPWSSTTKFCASALPRIHPVLMSPTVHRNALPAFRFPNIPLY